jgi:nucleoside-diphosphate-sugar epimerase
VKLIQKLTGKTEIKSIYEPPKLGDAPYTHADISKARGDLKYDPEVTLETGIQRFIDWVNIFKNR